MDGTQTKKGRLWPWYLLAAGWVVLDQIVKYAVRASMALGERRGLIPHILELYYVRNTGAAFSLFSSHTWVLTLISLAAAVVLAVALARRDWIVSPLGRLAMALLLGGAVGNLIDRALFGAVTDMFNFTFITFGVFNVADIGVVAGVVLLLLYLLLESRKDKRDGTDHPDEPQ